MKKQKIIMIIFTVFVLLNLIISVIPDNTYIKYDKAKEKTIKAVAGNVYVWGSADSGWYDATHVATVQEAVTNSSGGDTIYIYAGEYIEDGININKQLHFIGNGTSHTILNTDSSFIEFLELQAGASGSIIENIQFTDERHSDFGAIYITGGSDYIIRNCYFYRNEKGINSNTATVSNIQIYNNVFDDNYFEGEAITLSSNKENVFIHNNTFWGNCTTGTSSGIYINGGTNISIVDNVINSTSGRIWTATNNADNVTIARNTLTMRNDLYNNDVSVTVGIYVGKFENAVIEDNIVRQVVETTNTCGIYTGFCDGTNTNLLVRNNHIINYGVSLYVNSIAYGTVDNNNCQNGNGVGVNLITDGSGDGGGSPYDDTVSLNLTNNTINNKGGDGIYLEYESHNITICDNVITNITGNALDTDGDLINSIFHSNEIYNTSAASINLRGTGTTLNRIYNNNVTSSGTLGSDTAGGTNWWNLTSITPGFNVIGGFNLGGNYWSNYTGWDANGDGIGDQNYVANGMIDYYPLTNENISPIPDPPYNDSAVFNNTIAELNLTWDRGNFSDREVIIRNTDYYPTTPYDGTEVYNNTNTYYSISGLSEFFYYTVFSYNTTYNSYSLTGEDFIWGVLALRVFNESRPTQPVTNFDVLITNEQGTETYQNINCSNTHHINILDIPYGTNRIIQITAPYYKQRTYYKNLELYNFYNHTFYIPPLETDTEEGGGDDGGNTTETHLYVIEVIDPANLPIDDVFVDVRRYINTTDNFETVYNEYTDGNGKVTVYLVPGALYKVIMSKDGYITKYENYIPDPEYYGLFYPKTFKLYPEEEEYINETDCDTLSFTGNLNSDSDTLWLNMTNTGNGMTNWQLQIVEYNTTTATTTTIITTSGTNSTFSLSYDNTNNINGTNVYTCNLFYNLTDCNRQSITLVLSDRHGNVSRPQPPTSISEVDTIFNNYGNNPLGWSNTIGFFFLVFFILSFGQRNVGIAIMAGGGFMLFFNVVLGIALFGVALSILILVLGILVQWQLSKREARS